MKTIRKNPIVMTDHFRVRGNIMLAAAADTLLT